MDHPSSTPSAWTAAHTRARIAALVERAKTMRTAAEALDPVVATDTGVLVFVGDLCRRLAARQRAVQQATLIVGTTAVTLIDDGHVQFRCNESPITSPGLVQLMLPTLSPPVVFDLTHALGQAALLNVEIEVRLEVDGVRGSVILNRDLARPHLLTMDDDTTTTREQHSSPTMPDTTSSITVMDVSE